METKECPKCKGIMYHNKGISKKNGKPYENWNCSNPECKNIEWVDSNKEVAKEINTAKNMGMPETLNPKWSSFFDKVDEIGEDIKEIRKNTEKEVL